MDKNYGTVEFEGMEYTLTTDADFTSRMLEHSNNYNDVLEGENYDFEMAADAVDSKGKEYKVYWIFTDVKGEDAKELDSFDYDKVDRVEEA
jgi:hypothetical protein